jgi:uncharacterized protein YkwD
MAGSNGGFGGSTASGGSAGSGGAIAAGDLCAPCQDNAQCSAGSCLVNDSTGEHFCGSACSSAGGCPSGFDCVVPNNANTGQCVPVSGACAEDGGGGNAGSTGGSAGSSGGSSGNSGASGTSGTGGSTPVGHYETVTNPGATGDEPGGTIPVCCVPDSAEKAFIDSVFEQLNAYRLENGKEALAYDDALEAAVLGHCHHMAVHTFFDHDAPETPVMSPWARAELCGADAHGENIAYGQKTPEAVMTAWKDSPGHNTNMLEAGFKRVGIGYHDGYWGQLFGR